MLTASLLLPLLTLPLLTLAQNVTVPSTCTPGFSSGTDTVLNTLPYTYSQVMSIIGSYKNLTWSGNPDDTVTLNGTDNTVGTARIYDTAGAHVIETITLYSKPAAPGPYVEVHNTALLNVPSYNVSFYIMYDGTTVTSECNGKASMFNFTAHFCATNVTTAATILHTLHLADSVMVGTFLGGMNYTGCDAIAGGSGNVSSTSSGMSPSASAVTPFMGGATQLSAGMAQGAIVGLGLGLGLLGFM